MSSFKRKTASKPGLPAGIKASPSSPITLLTSTGIPSLDDILGGGLPLSCSLLILAPDPHSAYGQLVQTYSIAQGLVSGQTICIVDDNPIHILNDCMWIAPIAENRQDSQQDEKIKIAWRYESMKQFQTTVDANQSSVDEFCRTFDLTCRVPHSVVENAVESKRIVAVDLSSLIGEPRIIQSVLERIAQVCQASNSESEPLRVCVPSLGSPAWGEFRPQDILYFLHAVRSLLRRYPNACAIISLSPHISTETWGGSCWTQKLGWAVDAAITLSAFTADPSLSALFPAHHGFVHIHTLPAPHTMLAPSDKYSTLRGLSSSSSLASPVSGGGENNLAFKCMRKKMVFETLHLDLEGGVGERRTTPAANAVTFGRGDDKPGSGGRGEAAINVQIMEGGSVKNETGKSKVKKRVGFTSDRPDLYDF